MSKKKKTRKNRHKANHSRQINVTASSSQMNEVEYKTKPLIKVESFESENRRVNVNITESTINTEESLAIEEITPSAEDVQPDDNHTSVDLSQSTDDTDLGPGIVTSQMLLTQLQADVINPQTKLRRFYQKPLFLLVVFVMMVGGVLIASRLLSYDHVIVGDRQYASESADYIVQQTINLVKDQPISFRIANQPEIELKLGNAGISVNVDNLTNQINLARQLNFENFLFKKDIAVKFLIDYPVLQSVLDQHFKDKLVQPTDASLVYDKNQHKFVVNQSVDGVRVDARAVLPDAGKLKINHKSVITVDYQSVQPSVKTEAAKRAEDYLNQRLGLRLNLNHNGKLLYFADPWDIADWAVLTPDLGNGQFKIDFDKTKIQDFIEKTVSPQIARGVVNKKVLVDDNDNVLQILQHGQRGLGAVNPGDIATKIYGAVVASRNLDLELDVREIDFAEERIPMRGLKWIEVNLSRQTTTLFSGEQALQTFVISSGVHPWPTPTGTYKVWFKNPIQRMVGGSREAGDYYNLPNVRWNTYFNRDIGFHTAYWHNNFGYPMSHGCINMREADAKVLFDFAPIGTMVVVRY